MRTRILLPAALLLALAGAVTGCRGWTSEKPPVHLNPNMDTQEKLKPYRKSDFFADGRAMRTPPEGTVARGLLKEDDHFYRGTVDGKPATTFPGDFLGTAEDMQRGHERYNIYCAPCHDRAGTGMGTVAQRLTVKPPSFHDPRLKEMPVGSMYAAILNGVNNGNMPPYRVQINNEHDRWDILFYVRALQRAQDPNAPSFFAPAAATAVGPEGAAPAAPVAPPAAAGVPAAAVPGKPGPTPPVAMPEKAASERPEKPAATPKATPAARAPAARAPAARAPSAPAPSAPAPSAPAPSAPAPAAPANP